MDQPVNDDMEIYYTDHYVLPLPPGHRFPMRKYSALRERVSELAGTCLNVPAPASDDALMRVHDFAYIAAVRDGTLSSSALRRIGFPWTEAMAERARRSAGATIAACRAALAHGCGINLAGGTHHAHRAHGAGFCVFNDVAVAARAMQATERVARVLVVDLDVHQGDGTAAIFAGDDTVFTFSIHGRNNFPFRKASSDVDIELDDSTPDAPYLAVLAAALPRVMQRSSPDLAIYLAGADPFEGDRLGRLALSKAGLAARDRLVIDALRRAGVAVAIVMAGGYAENVDDVVDIHVNTVNVALECFGLANAARFTRSAPHIGAC